MGSGKSLVGALVAERAHSRFVDLDVLVEQHEGMTVADIFATRGEPAFRALERQLLPQTLRPETVVALGGGAVIDDDSWALVSSQALTVYLEASFDVLWRRIGQASGRPLIARRTRDEVAALFESRRARYESASHRVDAARHAGEVAGDVLKLWSD